MNLKNYGTLTFEEYPANRKIRLSF